MKREDEEGKDEYGTKIKEIEEKEEDEEKEEKKES